MNNPAASTNPNAALIDDPVIVTHRWRDIIGSQLDCSPFLHPVFQEGLDGIVVWKRCLLEIPSVGVASVFIRSRGPVLDLVLPPFCPYSAVLPASGASSDQLTRFLEPMDGVPSNRLFSFEPDVDIDAFQARGWQSVARFTYHLPTAPLEEAIGAWSSSQRRTFRKHADDYAFEVIAHPDASPEARALIPGLVALTSAGYERHGSRLPLDGPGLTRWTQDLLGSRLGRLYCLMDRRSGHLAAGVFALHHGPMAWFWLAGSKPGPAMTVLMARIQDDLAALDIPILDLMGANTPGIAEFKRRFGGRKIQYHHVRTSTMVGRLTDLAARTAYKLLS